MSECPQCGAQVAAGRAFCGKCRNRLVRRCPHCAFDNLIDDRFCGNCGRTLRTLPPASAPATSAGKVSLLYDQILSDAERDRRAFADGTTTMDRDAIKDLFQKAQG